MKEIEYKYLVKDSSWKQGAILSKSKLKQGYISSKAGKVVRVRISDSDAWITIKGPTKGITRDEYEYQIPFTDGKEMLDTLVEGSIIVKTRYVVLYGGKKWEIDVFAGDNKGLVTAEIELKSEKEKYKIPTWIGADVSDERKYSNSNLVKNPYKNWVK